MTNFQTPDFTRYQLVKCFYCGTHVKRMVVKEKPRCWECRQKYRKEYGKRKRAVKAGL